ncbi:MAG: hypothetical protein F6K07_32805 [Okeania sp. SIO1H5]|uniref:hypothetical protein n=1 Tax=Okeania sp. SIO1H5 TaxID=2607777 RepID=UPI0013BE4896|nr:hypothetical protein [Okeania sp. SIO1H5]NET23778.1 hypothetical protein [Okeania sp. SIO1H5]
MGRDLWYRISLTAFLLFLGASEILANSRYQGAHEHFASKGNSLTPLFFLVGGTIVSALLLFYLWKKQKANGQ